MLNNIPEPITVKEAATTLGCARSHVFWLIHTGKLSFKRLGKKFVLKRAEVEAFARAGWVRVGAENEDG